MNPLRAWNIFWFGPISARPLGAFRIAFGVIALANLAGADAELIVSVRRARKRSTTPCSSSTRTTRWRMTKS